MWMVSGVTRSEAVGLSGETKGRHPVKQLFVLVTLVLIGCSPRKDVGELPNGYLLMSLSSQELFVAAPNQALLVGPDVKELAVTGEVIVIRCGGERKTINGFTGTVGYNIVDSRSGQLFTNLTDAEYHARLKELNVEQPRLVDASVFLTKSMGDSK
jgi:hypothetical protein